MGEYVGILESFISSDSSDVDEMYEDFKEIVKLINLDPDQFDKVMIAFCEAVRV